MTASTLLASGLLQAMLGLLAGAVAGLAYFTSLRWSVRLFTQGGAVRALVLQLLRFGLMAVVLAALARLGATALLAAALGILAARRLVVARLGDAP